MHRTVYEGIDRAGLGKLLDRHPVDAVTIRSGSSHKFAGGYSSIGKVTDKGSLASIIIHPSVIDELMVGEFKPGKSTYLMGTDRKHAIRIAVGHEGSHHLHRVLQSTHPDLYEESRTLYNKGVKTAITKYASMDFKEWFAETHTAFMFYPEQLKAHDPAAFNFMSKVRREADLD
jgi:hypothetical protein